MPQIDPGNVQNVADAAEGDRLGQLVRRQRVCLLRIRSRRCLRCQRPERLVPARLCSAP